MREKGRERQIERECVYIYLLGSIIVISPAHHPSVKQCQQYGKNRSVLTRNTNEYKCEHLKCKLTIHAKCKYTSAYSMCAVARAVL